jgi:hypothetical protein
MSVADKPQSKKDARKDAEQTQRMRKVTQDLPVKSTVLSSKV